MASKRDQIIAALKSGEHRAAVARRFGVSRQYVGQLCARVGLDIAKWQSVSKYNFAPLLQPKTSKVEVVTSTPNLVADAARRWGRRNKIPVFTRTTPTGVTICKDKSAVPIKRPNATRYDLSRLFSSAEVELITDKRLAAVSVARRWSRKHQIPITVRSTKTGVVICKKP